MPTLSGSLRLYRVTDPKRFDNRRHPLDLEPHTEWANRFQAQTLPPERTAAFG
ncbi:hypothetical protein ACFFS2_18300 [Streptomyces aurantiacus]|nr:hypothetical protein [Streptomyces aurantiacus]